MDKKEWADQDFKIIGTRNITIVTEYLSPHYAKPLDAIAEKPSSTGHLVLLKIEPIQEGLPSFWARWDHGQRCVDIDLKSDPRETRKFKDQKRGYRGHKTKVATEDGGPRTYAIDIATPRTGRVFKGTLALNIDWAQSLDAGMYAIAGFDVSAKVVTPWWRWIARRFSRM